METPLKSSPSHCCPMFQSHDVAIWSIAAKFDLWRAQRNLTANCGAPHTDARPPPSYNPKRRVAMAARFGSRTMTFGEGRPRSRPIERDEAADASRFFSRIPYAVLALGGPVSVVIHPLALFVIFPIGVALILMSAALEAKG